MSFEDRVRLERAAKLIQRKWRAYQKRKAAGLTGGSSQGFLASADDEAVKSLKKRPTRFAETIGIHNYHDDKPCSICSKSGTR